MGNCLVTKLKGTVDNIDLPILNGLNIRVKATEPVAQYVEAPQSNSVTLKAENGTFDIGGSSYSAYTIPAGSQIYFVCPACDMSIKTDTFRMRMLRPTNDVSAPAFSYEVTRYAKMSNSIYWLDYRNPDGEGELVFSRPGDMERLIISSDSAKINNLYTNINQFANSNIKELKIVGSESYGSIVSLGKSLNLDLVRIQNCNNLTGEVNDLADALVANGKRSGRIVLFGPIPGCTDDGNPITGEYLISKGGTNPGFIRINFNSDGTYTKAYHD